MAKKKSFVLSTEAINSNNIILMTAGLVLDDFLANPVMFADHRNSSFDVVGRWENIRIENGTLVADPVFDESDEAVLKLASKVQNDFVRAVSIGGRPLEWYFEDRNGIEVCICTKFHVLEASIVAIPSNKSCLRLYDNENKLLEKWVFSDLKTFDFVVNKQPKTPTKMSDWKTIGKMLGLSDNVTEAEVMSVVEAGKKAQDDLAQLKTQQKNSQQQKASSMIDAAIAENRIDASKREKLVKLADMDFDLFEDTLGAIPKPASLSSIVRHSAVVQGNGTGNGRDLWTFADWEKKDPNGLSVLRSSNPRAFEALYESEYGVDFNTDIANVKGIGQ